MGNDDEPVLRETVAGLLTGEVQWNVRGQKYEKTIEAPDTRTRVTTETTTTETTENWENPKR